MLGEYITLFSKKGNYVLNTGDKTDEMYHKSFVDKVYFFAGDYLIISKKESFVEIRLEPFGRKRGELLGYGITARVPYGDSFFGVAKYKNATIRDIDYFYYCLRRVDESDTRRLYVASTYDLDRDEFEFYGSPDMGDYYIGNSGRLGYQYRVEFSYDRTYNHKVGGAFTKAEFYMLIQIFYGVYNEAEIKKQLETKEKEGCFEGIDAKNYELCRKHPYIEEYLLLELIRKDISGAFEGEEIQKVFDEEWEDAVKQSKVEEINTQLGIDLMVLDWGDMYKNMQG